MLPEWGGAVPTEVFFAEGRKIVDVVSRSNVPLRLIGGVAVPVHSKKFADFQESREARTQE